MEYCQEKVTNGLLNFRNINSNDQHNGVYYNLRDYDNEAFFFEMDEVEFVTYSKSLESKVKENNFIKYFSDQVDYELALNQENYQSYANPRFKYRILSKEDAITLDTLKTKCSNLDLCQAQVSIEDALVVGAFDKQELIAVASIWELTNDLADIGVLVSPSYRNKQVGLSVVSKLVDEIIDKRIPIYRADYENQGSLRLAGKLGFHIVTRIYRLK